MAEFADEDGNNPYRAPRSGGTDGQAVDPAQLQLASRWTRFFAALIDGFAILALLWGGLYLSTGITPASLPQRMTTEIQIAMTMGGYLCFFLIHAYLLFQRSQTFGKFVFGIKIVGVDGQEVSFWTIILKRYLPTWLVGHIPYAGGFIGIIDALFIFRKDKRCVHDLIAGTKVVKLEKVPTAEKSATTPSLESTTAVM